MAYVNNQSKKQSGFTLVEVLVSLSIFTLVSVAAVGVLLVMIDANAKSQNIQSAMSNLSFALDSMTRDIRTGYEYYCGNDTDSDLFVEGQTQDCSSGNDAFSFDEGGGSLTGSCSSSRIAFRLHEGAIERRLCGTEHDWQAITADNVTVDTLEFILTGSDRGDVEVPIVTIYIDGTVRGKENTGASFQTETTITQQVLNI